MFVLEKQRINRVELDGTVFEDVFYVKVAEATNKQQLRRLIKDKYADKGIFRMIHPGGAVSDPMTIKLQQNGKRPKPVNHRLLHRICDDYDPIVIPTNPRGRMRILAKALRGE